MTNARKNLKLMSIVILALTVFSFVRVGLSAFSMDFNMEELPEGTTASIILAAQIALCVFSFILLLPQIYVGVKGMKIAKNPDNSKAHIVWATILAVLSVICIISPVAGIIRTGDFAGNFAELIDVVTDAAVYFAYVGYAKQVLKAA